MLEDNKNKDFRCSGALIRKLQYLRWDCFYGLKARKLRLPLSEYEDDVLTLASF